MHITVCGSVSGSLIALMTLQLFPPQTQAARAAGKACYWSGCWGWVVPPHTVPALPSQGGSSGVATTTSCPGGTGHREMLLWGTGGASLPTQPAAVSRAGEAVLEPAQTASLKVTGWDLVSIHAWHKSAKDLCVHPVGFAALTHSPSLRSGATALPLLPSPSPSHQFPSGHQPLHQMVEMAMKGHAFCLRVQAAVLRADAR